MCKAWAGLHACCALYSYDALPCQINGISSKNLSLYGYGTYWIPSCPGGLCHWEVCNLHSHGVQTRMYMQALLQHTMHLPQGLTGQRLAITCCQAAACTLVYLHHFHTPMRTME